jgi:acetylornithine deacetylase/succinyl-diaminopimelate desuccinylase-like protein
MEFIVRGPSRDLHSGAYGGSVYNPAQLVADIVAAMHDAQGVVQIPGFYDHVRLLTPEERVALARVPYGLDEWSAETGLRQPWGEQEYTILERIGARPTCEVNGIYGGFMEKGAKTVIPAMAGAKVSMRLVADQDPRKIERLFIDFVSARIPADYTVEFINHTEAWPAITPLDSHEIRAAARAYAAAWGREPVYTREGGSIPITAVFQKELGAPVVLMGFGLDDHVHAPDEHFLVDHFYRGIDAAIHYFFNLVE